MTQEEKPQDNYTIKALNSELDKKYIPGKEEIRLAREQLGLDRSPKLFRPEQYWSRIRI